jgi:hypothetical protein
LPPGEKHAPRISGDWRFVIVVAVSCIVVVTRLVTVFGSLDVLGVDAGDAPMNKPTISPTRNTPTSSITVRR